RDQLRQPPRHSCRVCEFEFPCKLSRGGNVYHRPSVTLRLDVHCFSMDTTRAAYDEVYVYTMGRPGFILQHVVDAFAVQTATDGSKPIAVVFGLVGLYLHVEKQFSGRQVQEAHIKLGRRKREWP